MAQGKFKTLEIAHVSFKFSTDAYTEVEKYLEGLDTNFEKSEDRDEIILDMRTRFAENLLELKKEEPAIFTKEEVNRVIKKMGNGKEVEAELPEKIIGPKKIHWTIRSARILGYMFYWFPHLLWIFYLFGGSFLFVVAIISGPEDLTLPTILTYIGALILPVVGLFLGIYLNIKRDLRGMLLFLLGIEIPLFLLAMFRILLLQVFSLPIALGFGFIFLACITLLFDILKVKKVTKYVRVWEVLKLTGYGIGTLMSGYVLLIWSFFAPAVIIELINAVINFTRVVFSFNPYNGGDSLFPFSLLWLPLFAIVYILALLFFVSPIYAFAIYSLKLISNLKVVASRLLEKKERLNFQFKKSGLTVFSVFQLLTPLLSIVLVIVIIIAASIGNPFGYYRERDIEIAINSKGDFDSQRVNYLKLSDNDNFTKSLIKSKFFARYEHLFDANSDEVFNQLYCKRKYFDISYSDYNRDIEITLPEYVCSQMYSTFSFFVTPVVYDGDLEKDFDEASIEYKKVFDDDIQRAESADIRYYSANTLTESVFGTGRFVANQGAKLVDEDEKRVNLKSVEITTEINPEQNLHTTSYTLTFRNKEITNQEVYMEFTLPENNVLTDLKLGDQLQNPGIIAPKAAASNVYEQSLRRSIDPALLEMVGPRTYRLRVFPIPPRDGDITRRWSEVEERVIETKIPNFQKVQFTYAGIVDGEYKLIDIPYTRNIDSESISSISGTIHNVGRSANPINWTSKTKDISSLSKMNANTGVGYDIPCYDFIKNKSELNLHTGMKRRIFFDVSKSAEDKRDEYIKFMQNLGLPYAAAPQIEVYEYNFGVNKVFEFTTDRGKVIDWLKNVKFWGYSDRGNIAEYLKSTSDEYGTITFVLTDDSDFEFTNKSNYEMNYSTNQNNGIYLIQFGERNTSQKEEINNLIWASGGTSYLINSDLDEKEFLKQSSEIQRSIFEQHWCDESKQTNIEYPTWKRVIDQISALEKTKSSIQVITNSADRIIVAKASNQSAKENHIIDPFNSMIALETDWQKNQLEQESKKKNAFDKSFDIGEENLVTPWMVGNVSMPESDGLFIMMTIFAILAGMKGVGKLKKI